MNKKTIIAIIVIVILVIFGVYKVFIQKEKPGFTLIKVSRGTISQEVSETGTVEKGEEIKLAFENTGKIEKIYVKIGDEVETNTKLAELNTNQLSIQLKEAEASLGVAQANLDKLLVGVSPEEIKVYQTDIQNSQISLETAKENLIQAYDDALNILDDSYLKLFNAFNAVDIIYKKYFTGSDQESIKFKENKIIIETSASRAKYYLDIAKTENKNENVDNALSEMKNSCNITSSSLAILRTVCDDGIYYSSVSSTDKTSIDTQRTNISTALTNITNSHQLISSTKLTLKSAEGQLQKDQDELALLIAKPRQEDIDLYQAQIKQAEAQIELIKDQIAKSAIFSPLKGQITKINKKEGEIVQATEQFIYLISANPFQIKVDIYEEDVVKLSVGNEVDITLTAFPDKILKGKLVFIDPAEKLVEGVVYYEATIDFDVSASSTSTLSEIEWVEDYPQGIKPGMTADVIIKSFSKNDVLVIPGAAIEQKGGKAMVQVSKGKNFEEREIEIGLKGSDDMVEVISGLSEGEEVIIKD